MIEAEVRIRAALESDRFALVGAGQLGEMALDLWPDTVAPPVFVLDSHRRGTVRGRPIEGLTDHQVDPAITYLISAFKIAAFEARAMASALNQPDLVTVYDFFERYIPRTISNGWRNLDPSPTDLARIERARQCYVEEASRLAFDAVVAWRYRRDLVDDYPLVPETDKYNLSRFGRDGWFYDHVYDCGCYDLGLVASLAKAGVTYKSFVAFEPDPSRRAICREAARALDGQGPIRIERGAVCDVDGHEPFVASGLFSARLSSDISIPRSTVVETCTLDTYHAAHGGWRDGDVRVLIKAHVESAEPRVLAGAHGLLERTRADVLINLSHDEASFLDIPCVLASLNRYDLFLRASSLFGEGLTLFARHRRA